MKSDDSYWGEIGAFLVTLFIIALISAATWQLVPSTSVPFHELSQQLLIADTSLIAPEANEQAAFVIATISIPLVIWLATAFTGCIPATSPMVAACVWTATACIAIAFSIPHDIFRLNLIDPVSHLPWKVIVLLLAAIASFLWQNSIWRISNNVIFTYTALVSSMLALILIGYATKIMTEYDIPAGDVHLSAFYYSINQTYYGATCLADLIPQYGCYGEFFSVVIWPFGISPLSVTVAAATMGIISGAAILVFAARLIRSAVPFLAFAIWLIILTNGIFWQDSNPEPYFQYWPLRTLFPSLGLLVSLWWTRSPSLPRAAALGVLAGLSIWWNPDTGTVVCVALASLIVTHEVTKNGASIRFFRGKLLLLGTYIFAVVTAGLMFLVYLTIKSGRLILPTQYLEYQQTFAMMGFNMLPLPPLPDAWGVCLALAIAVLTVFSVAIRCKRHSPRLELAVFCSVMGIGLFIYFIGRSHPIVFLLVAWPFLILLFYLLERWQARLAGLVWMAAVPRALILLALVTGLSTMAYSAPKAIAKASAIWTRNTDRLPEPQIRTDANYIASIATPDRSVGILSNTQAFITSALQRRSEIPGPGIQEVIRRADAEAVVESIRFAGPDDLFIEAKLLTGDLQTWGSLPWVAEALPLIMQSYDRAGTSPDGNMIYFRHR